MSEWIYLSYPINCKIPVYGNGPGIQIIRDKDMANGDSCNTSQWSLSSHLGTHVDLPRHFVQHGKCVTDYPSDFWFFSFPAVIDISPVTPGSVIGPKELNLDCVPEDIDMLLIKTGFCHLRQEEVYWKQNPGFAPELADSLRKEFSGLRVLGLDSISLSSFVHRDLGRQTHRVFLDGERPILPLEDLDLISIGADTELKEVIVAPIRIENADGAPCTVIGKIS